MRYALAIAVSQQIHICQILVRIFDQVLIFPLKLGSYLSLRHLVRLLLLALQDLGHLRRSHLFEVSGVPHFIIDLVLDAREDILHIHDGIIHGQILPQGRIGGLPPLKDVFLMLFLLSFGHFLQLVMIDPLLRLKIILLEVFHDADFVVPDNLVHLLDGVSLGCEDKPLVPLVLNGLHVLRDLVT
jgi:hypothetical protein